MGFKIKEYREQQGITQKELAKKAGVSRTIINQLETGAKKNTSAATLTKIAAALRTTVGDIFF